MSIKENIPNIFNYCDNWCEHCAFCDRCQLAKMNEAPLPAKRVMTFDERLNDFTKKMRNLTDMLTKELEKLIQINGETIPPVIVVSDETKNEQNLISVSSFRNQPIATLSSNYIFGVTELITNKLPLKETFDKLLEHVNMGILSGQDAIKKSKRLNSTVDEILWYQDLIHAKLFAATTGLMNYTVTDKANKALNNYNGHAKIALIAIEQSLLAWIYIRDTIVEYEDDVLEQLATLQKMKKLVEETFPDAWSFKRPGFDD